MLEVNIGVAKSPGEWDIVKRKAEDLTAVLEKKGVSKVAAKVRFINKQHTKSPCLLCD